MAAATRPVFGQKAEKPKRVFVPGTMKVAKKQESFDFLSECTKALEPGKYFFLRRAVKLFARSLDSRAAADFIIELADRTDGAEFSEDYGPAAAELAKPLKTAKGSKEYRHPRWAAFTVAQVARAACTTESGAMKLLAELEEMGSIESRRWDGRVWYAMDLERMEKLTKRREARKSPKAPKIETSNIPHDASGPDDDDVDDVDDEINLNKETLTVPMIMFPGAKAVPLAKVCPQGDGCCLVEKWADGNAQLVDSIRQASEKPAEQSRFLDDKENVKPAEQSRFLAKTLTLKPGQYSVPASLGSEIWRYVRFRNASGHVISATPILTGQTLDIELGGVPAVSASDVEKWRRPINAVIRKYWKEKLEDPDVAQIAGIIQAVDSTVEDWVEWADLKCTRGKGRVPRELAARNMVKLTREDFQPCRLDANNADIGIRKKSDLEKRMGNYIETGKLS